MRRVTSNQFANNAMWKFADMISNKLILLVITILLARLITPEAYGVVALTMVFIGFSDIFILNGFNIALIRKETVDEIDYSTVTTMSLVFTVFMYLIIFVTAPYAASFYKSPDLCLVLRIITILLFFRSIVSVIRAKGTRELQFKRMVISAFISNVSAGVIALVLAYLGWGIWALVAQQLLAGFLDMIILMHIFRWHLSLKISFSVVKGMLKFTVGVLGTSFLDFLGNNVSSLIIGKSYSTKDLGYYNRANILPETIGLNAYNSINSVLLPTLASLQNDRDAMKRVTRKVMSLTEYIILPMMFGLIGVANVLIPVLLTDKWVSSIPLMYFCCISFAINPIRAIGYNVFYARGDSRLSVNIEILRATLMIVILIVILVFQEALIYVLLSNALISLVVAGATHYRVKSCIGYSFRELYSDVFPSLVMSLIMMSIVLLVGNLQMNKVLLLIIQVLIGGTIYMGMSLVLKNKNFVILKDYIVLYVRK
ncbi:lipopolysaccharide biosynthesis protein [Bacteroides thetaiotaomicron]|uniref:lipopolysaccharide biosynthesis protein n=1 Tax=Bacteroides thetaiotaomicron TaxID=818 RepID=UPI00232CC471|nr:lipopolysaccharide biosynthesis protein [Bacteroides thetaiotaomicron]MDC2095785.1 lipopolysaccharide biosynthesis protein [Bacteroides thetaiotaomicron]MDC2117854.1 lipopolysaccharide biosynthesis protein [Bacteroides thetaiotaomicron]MDC2122839.1 lipopolysaccharide biosynthesis protein [Bacteroides thetaiotaomicron]MDC2125144.1 lipopolysaccharide biosynthesis protein [Bacteroides thetaiotaomicron]